MIHGGDLSCHTKQLNPCTNSSASRVVNHSQLSACQGKMGPFEGHPSTCVCQTGLRRTLEWKQTVQASAILNTCAVGELMSQTNNDEKCVLKLCEYKISFGKICMVTYIISWAYKVFAMVRHTLTNINIHHWNSNYIYITLIRFQLTYSSQLWCPYTTKDIINIEQVQRRATKYILNNYSTYHKSRMIQLQLLLTSYVLFKLQDIIIIFH